MWREVATGFDSLLSQVVSDYALNSCYRSRNVPTRTIPACRGNRSRKYLKNAGYFLESSGIVVFSDSGSGFDAEGTS